MWIHGLNCKNTISYDTVAQLPDGQEQLKGAIAPPVDWLNLFTSIII